MEQLMLDVGQANEIKLAARRAGATNADLKTLSEGDMFVTILPVLRGQAEVKVVSFFRPTEDLGDTVIPIPALPRPTLTELRSKFPWIREENGIERDDSPTEAVVLSLGTVLTPSEKQIGGKEYEGRRLGLAGCLGYQHGLWLVEHQDEYPAFEALLGQVYIDLTGLVVVRADGGRYFPCLGQYGERWYLYWHWADIDLYSDGRVACSRT